MNLRRFVASSFLSIAISWLCMSTVCFAGNAPLFQFLTEDLPPYSYRKANGEISGLCVEIVREVQKKMGHPDNIKVEPWSRAYNVTLENDNQALFSTIRNAERENLFKWVGPLIYDKTVFYARKGSGIRMESIEDAKKVGRIGVYKDDAGEIMLRSKGFTNLDSVVEDRLNARKLAAGRVDLWLTSDVASFSVIKEEGLSDRFEVVFTYWSEPMYIAFNRNTPDSEIARWQKALDALKADGNYEEILKKYGAERSSRP